MTFRVSPFAVGLIIVAFIALNWLIEQPWAPLGTFVADAMFGVCGVLYARQTAVAALPVFIFLLKAERSKANGPYVAIVGCYWLAIVIGLVGTMTYFLYPDLYADWV